MVTLSRPVDALRIDVEHVVDVGGRLAAVDHHVDLVSKPDRLERVDADADQAVAEGGAVIERDVVGRVGAVDRETGSTTASVVGARPVNDHLGQGANVGDDPSLMPGPTT